MKNFKFTFLIVALATLLFSCAKDGATGPAGTNGATGATGATGNANVEIFTFNIDSAQWLPDSANLQWGVLDTLPASANVTGGVYLYVQDVTFWAALPHVDYGMTTEFEFDPSTKILNIQSADARAQVMIANPGAKTFRAICIPPAGRMANPNLNYKNYDEVVKAFGIKCK
jgi:hypothetical protein